MLVDRPRGAVIRLLPAAGDGSRPGLGRHRCSQRARGRLRLRTVRVERDRARSGESFVAERSRHISMSGVSETRDEIVRAGVRLAAALPRVLGPQLRISELELQRLLVQSTQVW